MSLGRLDSRATHWARRSKQRGQTIIFVVIGLGLVFMAVLGFAVDFGNMWFHRQNAQSAADATCTAAAMDMLYNVAASPSSPVGGFTPGTNFNCTTSGSPTSGPCQYAALNGYNGTGLVANTESNAIDVTFPSSVTGVPVLTIPLPPGGIAAPPTTLVPNPFVQVDVKDRIRTTFFALVSSSNTIDVPARAVCGVVMTTSPIPILVLDPTRQNTFTLSGGSQTVIYGGPPDSVQINSNNALAFNKNGNSGLIDLHQGGPSTTGSNFHVNGTQTNPPTTAQTCSGVDLCYGTTGNYGNHLPIPDPLAVITAPSQPTWTGTAPATNGNSVQVDADVDGGTHGCPAPTTKKCIEYYPGYYPSGINLAGQYAIFAPGIYYILGGMNFGSNSCVRPSSDTGDGSKGTFFYFADDKSINVPANTGCNTNPQTTAAVFNTKTGTGSLSLGVFCDSTALTNGPGNLPNTIDGSVLLAPCTAPNAGLSMCAPNCAINGGLGYGDLIGPSNPAGVQRGLLLMQNRNRTLGNSDQPSWQGGGNFLISGTMYFHQCKTTGGADTGGTGCTTSAYLDQLTIGGNSTGTSYVLGDVIVDQLNLHGNSALTMDLSPNRSFVIYKASLLQ